MQSVLIVIHLLVVIALIAVVLLQRSEGGALGTGGGGGFMTGRGQANALSRATAILGALYFVTALVMSGIAGWTRAPKSILDTAPTTNSSTETAPGKAAPAPAPTGNILDQLKGEAPAAPSAPATETPK